MNQQLYTTTELNAMSSEELRRAQANGFVKQELPASEAPGFQAMGQESPTPPPSPQDPYAVTAWGESEYDFRVPSGQLCRMRKLRPEQLIGLGVLDAITRLPGFAEEQVQKAEGHPPTVAKTPTPGEMQELIAILDKVIPAVVVKPTVRSVPAGGEERVSGVVYTEDIDLGDRIAIMERSTLGVKRMDNFRQES